MTTDKTAQRKIIKERINEYNEKIEAGDVIGKKFLSLEEYKKAVSIFIYMSTENEVSTEGIIKDAFARGKRVFVPVTKEKLLVSEIFPYTIFEGKKFGIKEPKLIVLPDIEIDLAVIPLVGFDNDNNRLGHGKGYYDKFLATFDGKKIAFAFSVQRLEKIITDENDIKMDMIITEE